MGSIHAVLNALAYCIGYGALIVGGITAAAMFAWICVERLLECYGMAERVIRYSLYVKQMEKGGKEDG
jgi:hypothetical protein